MIALIEQDCHVRSVTARDMVGVAISANDGKHTTSNPGPVLLVRFIECCRWLLWEFVGLAEMISCQQSNFMSAGSQMVHTSSATRLATAGATTTGVVEEFGLAMLTRARAAWASVVVEDEFARLTRALAASVREIWEDELARLARVCAASR